MRKERLNEVARKVLSVKDALVANEFRERNELIFANDIAQCNRGSVIARVYYAFGDINVEIYRKNSVRNFDNANALDEYLLSISEEEYNEEFKPIVVDFE